MQNSNQNKLHFNFLTVFGCKIKMQQNMVVKIINYYILSKQISLLLTKLFAVKSIKSLVYLLTLESEKSSTLSHLTNNYLFFLFYIFHHYVIFYHFFYIIITTH